MSATEHTAESGIGAAPDIANVLAETDEHSAHSACITHRRTWRFANLSGDRNDIHLNRQVAKNSIFGGRVAHGMHSAIFISAALEGLDGQIILLSQNLEYEAPVEIGAEVTAHAIPVETLNDDPEIVRCLTPVVTNDGDLVITGEATIRRE